MQNPQNPYSSPSVAPSVSPRGPEVTLDTIGQAWKLLQPNLGVWIGAFAIYAGVIYGQSILQNYLSLPRAIAFIFSLIGFAIGQFLLGGLMRMAINTVRTGRAEFGQLFSAGDVAPSLIGAGLITGISTLIGTFLCIVPGLLLSGLFMFVTPLIVDKRQGAIEAIGSSFNTLKPQMWNALLFVLVVGLLVIAGAIACGVGMLVTAPLGLLAIAITYNNFFGGGQSAVQAPMSPVAPIADPFK